MKKWFDICKNCTLNRLHNQPGTNANLIFVAKAAYGMAETAPVQEMYDRAILYSHLFGNELEELMKISDLAARWCRTYGYNHLSVYANEEADIYTGRGIAKNKDGAVQDVKIKLNKPRKITVAELEEKLGYPVEIVS